MRIPEDKIFVVRMYLDCSLPVSHSAVTQLMPLVGKLFDTSEGISKLCVTNVNGVHNEMLVKFYSISLSSD